jgi:hypothetical protein
VQGARGWRLEGGSVSRSGAVRGAGARRRRRRKPGDSKSRGAIAVFARESVACSSLFVDRPRRYVAYSAVARTAQPSALRRAPDGAWWSAVCMHSRRDAQRTWSVLDVAPARHSRRLLAVSVVVVPGQLPNNTAGLDPQGRLLDGALPSAHDERPP